MVHDVKAIFIQSIFRLTPASNHLAPLSTLQKVPGTPLMLSLSYSMLVISAQTCRS